MAQRSKCERRQALERRGRRVLGFVAAFFLLAQLSAGLVLDWVWIRPRHPWWADRLADLKALPKPPDIYFFGSSRFGGDINCDVLDAQLREVCGNEAPRTFNASIPAGDATLAERMFDDIKRLGVQPKMVVLEVDPGALAGRDNWLYQHALNVLDWRDVPEVVPALCKNRRIQYLARGRLLPIYVHRHHIRKEAFKSMMAWFEPSVPPAVHSAALAPAPKDLEPPPLSPKVRALMEEGYNVAAREVKDFHLDGVATRRLERLLDRCRAEGIAVVMVGVPVSSPYRRASTPEVDAQFLAYMDRLTNEYGCTYTDWRDKVPDPYFIDGHHANDAGGIYFSRRFANVELIPAWRATARR
jgi:hypothetical protein